VWPSSSKTREVILRFDSEQELRDLQPWERDLRRSLKLKVLGLASLSRTIAQRSRISYLAEGDANTRFFHLQACHRIEALRVQGTQLVTDHSMAHALYEFYKAILGSCFERSRRVDFLAIGVPSAQLDHLENLFSEEEVWSVIKEMPSDKAPGPDGFSGRFYKLTWGIIKGDVMNSVNAFWSQDFRSFHHLNEAFMVLLKKREQPEEIRDFRPISLIHSFGKLITKCLAYRLAPLLNLLVQHNQSAFICGRCIHDTFREVHLSCKAIHRSKRACVLLRIDIAKAFDTVSWAFLLELLQHMGFGLRWHNWISAVLSSASTKILLNGRPGRQICHTGVCARATRCLPCSSYW
jgi:hypothetical protein